MKIGSCSSHGCPRLAISRTIITAAWTLAISTWTIISTVVDVRNACSRCSSVRNWCCGRWGLYCLRNYSNRSHDFVGCKTTRGRRNCESTRSSGTVIFVVWTIILKDFSEAVWSQISTGAHQTWPFLRSLFLTMMYTQCSLLGMQNRSFPHMGCK